MARKNCNSTQENPVCSGESGEKQETFSSVTSLADKFKNKFYRISYYTGVQLMRLTRRLKRHGIVNLKRLQKRSWQSTRVYYSKAKLTMRALDRDLLFPIKLLKRSFKEFAANQKTAFSQGAVQLALFYAKTLQHLAVLAFKQSGKVFNYAAPVVSIVVLVYTVQSYTGLTYALQVNYNGEDIGYIQNEADFEEAEKRMKARIIYEDYIEPVDTIPKFTLSVVDNTLLTDSAQLTDKLIEASGNELAEASGLYIGSTFMGATTDPNSMLLMLDSMKQAHSTGDPSERVEFVKDVKLIPGLYPVTSIVDLDNIESELQKDESEQRLYTVQKGDAPTVIAQKYNMDYADLKALNPTIEKKLMVGQEVLISRSVPFLAVQTTKTVTEEEEVPFKINQKLDNNYNQGYTKVTQEGKKGTKEIKAQVTYIDGVETERIVLDSRIVQEPKDEVIIVGGNKPLQQLPPSAMVSDTNFIRPVVGGYVSAGLYGYRGHTGMDIAVPIGTPVRAAASGTVVVSKYWGGAYGHYVKIDHGGGVQTLYAHNSKLHVQVGDFVQQGQLIASVGMTGRTSGAHCHFEVLVGGRVQDPAKYIGSR